MLKEFLNNSYLFGGNAPFIEELYEKYLVNPQSVPDEWRNYFDRMQDLPGALDKDVAHAPVVESFIQRSKRGEFAAARTMPAEHVTPERLQVAALLLVTAYRIAGSRWATVDPLKRMPRPNIPELEPAYYDLKEADLDQTVNSGSFVGLEEFPYACWYRRFETPTVGTSASNTCSSRIARSGNGSRSVSSRCAARRKSPRRSRSACCRS